MSGGWATALKIDPLPALLAPGDEARAYFVRRDLLGEAVGPVEALWETRGALQVLRKQQPDGSWCYPGARPDAICNYNLLETYRNLRLLVEMYGCDRRHPAVEHAAAYVLSCQSPEGDIRGILGPQYMPYYHGAILELLVKAGYGDDARVERGLTWLLSVRQDDGGWIVPVQAVAPGERSEALWRGAPLQPDRSRPSAHMATGMALRALAAHPRYRGRPEAQAAGTLLKSRFFKADCYNDRKAPAYWLKLQYPFWWSNLLTALDSLSLLGFARGDADVGRGLAWFLGNQEADGLWNTSYDKGSRAAATRLWVGLAVCRTLQRFYWKGKSVTIQPRRYESVADLLEIGALLRRAYARDLHCNAWSPARFDIWAQRRIADGESFGRRDWQEATGLWEDAGGALVGAAFFDRGCEAGLIVDPERRELAAVMLDWLEARHEASRLDGRSPAVEALQGNAQLAALLQARGYARSADFMTHRKKPLAGTPDEPVRLPPGFELRQLQAAEDLERHRAAVKVVFRFEDTADAYRSVQRAPSYIPELDLVAVSPQGEVAAFCSLWLDRVNNIAEFEPVGTVPEYRRRGLAAALLATGANRLRAMGVAAVAVDSWSESPAANQLYAGAGFVPWDCAHSWQQPDCQA